MRRFPLLLLIWLLVGCGTAVPQVPPTLVPQATFPFQAGEGLATVTPSPPGGGVSVGRDGRNAPSAAAATESAPIAAGESGSDGVRPADAEQLFVRDAGPELPPEQRPPVYPVPLSIHPDDHYWLIRPIPSIYRNYDLDWYPFGNFVNRPDMAPYRVHHGNDYPNETGTPIVAAGSGTVVHVGALPSPRNGFNYYGNTVIIEHDWQWQGQPVFTLYAHTLELFVEVGDVVRQGQLIAGVGSSGEVSGPHLHFEVRVGENAYPFARNPALWLAPFEGYGTLAGRLVDRRGQPISEAELRVVAVDGVTAVRNQRTYHPSVMADDVWNENFVVPDLPAGRYELLLTAGDITYRREVEIFAGQTTFEVISTEFDFVPTPTPLPTATPTDTPTPEAETTVEPTPTTTP